jgi:WS/DGAT/MGAT family acyltransferase
MDPVDAAWWRMDSATNRMAIVAVMQFDRPFSVVDFTDLLRDRLAGFPRFRLRVTRFRGRLCWEEDPQFDYANHVLGAEPPEPSDSSMLKALAGRLMSSALPADRPPWQFTVIDGYRGGSAVIARLHHAIADGMALIHVLKSLGDGSDRVSAPEDESELIDDEPSRMRSFWANMGSVFASLFKFAFTGSDRKSQLRGRLSEQKRVDWSSPIDLKQLRKTAISYSASINDVLLAAFAGGLRRYLERTRQLTEDFELRALVPVNLRHRHDKPGLGNRFGLVILSLPVGLRRLADRVAEINQRMLRMRSSMEAESAYGILTALGRSPGFVEDAAVWKLSATSSAAITHVPGPRSRLVMAGRVLEDVMFWVPRGGSVGMGISILTYAGRARIGLAMDSILVPDPDRLTADVEEELALLT